MNPKSAWLYLVLGAVALYVLWGLYVHATVTGLEDEVRVRYTPTPSGAAATDEERIDWALVDSLPWLSAPPAG